MQLPYSDVLDIAHFSRLFDNKSECYKLFWFQAIARKIKEGHEIVTFEALIDEMIADAWYMVSEYRLNLGPNDALERVVHRLSEISNMKSCEKKEVILEYLDVCDDKEVIVMKRTLSQNVPYRLQAPFMESMKGKEWNRSGEKLAARINQEKRLMYYFLQFPWSEHPNSNTEGMGGLYREELRNYTGLGRIKSDSISPEKKPQRSRNCGQAISTERAESGKGKKVLENDCYNKTCLRNLWEKTTGCKKYIYRSFCALVLCGA